MPFVFLILALAIAFAIYYFKFRDGSSKNSRGASYTGKAFVSDPSFSDEDIALLNQGGSLMTSELTSGHSEVTADGKPLLDKFHLDTHEGSFYVLVVEGDEEIRTEIATHLDHAGCRVQTAASGADALIAVAKDKFDMLFISARMPYMDGVQTLRNIRNAEQSKSKDAIAYVLMDERDLETDENFEQNGFAGTIRTPIEFTCIDLAMKEHAPKKMLTQSSVIYDRLKNLADMAGELQKYGVRVHEGLQHAEYDKFMYRKNAIRFCNSFEEDRNEIYAILNESKDQTAYMNKAREMREKCRKIGAIYLSDIFDDHVNMAKEDTLEVAEMNWRSLLLEWERVVEGLASWIGRSDVNPTNKADTN